MNVLRILLATVLLCAVSAAHGHVLIFTGTLVPEGGGGRMGAGSVQVDYEEEFHQLTIAATFSGLSGTTSVAHIHCCTVESGSGNAGVAIQAPTLTGFPVGIKSYSYLNSFDLTQDGVFSNPFISNFGGGTKAGAEAALLAALNTGKAYFNIHTNPTFTGGEIRAVLNPVPEPGTVALMLAGLGVVGWAVRRRTR